MSVNAVNFRGSPTKSSINHLSLIASLAHIILVFALMRCQNPPSLVLFMSPF